VHNAGLGDAITAGLPIVTGMIPRTQLPRTLLELAESQVWTLSRAQVLTHGPTDRVISRLLRTQWWAIAPGVYSLRPEPSWLGWCWAGLLVGGPGSSLGLAAAAHLHRLIGSPPDEILVWLPEDRQVRRREPWIFRRGVRAATGSPPRTSIVRTVLDLAAVQPTDALVGVLAEAVGRRGVRPAEILAGLATLPRHPRRRLLTDLLADVHDGVRSPLELRYLQSVERALGLPVAERQASPSGRFEVDALYEDFGTVVELDGRTYHEGAARFRDYTRDNRHIEMGLATLRLGWADVVDRPCAVARQVAAVLTHHGWTGTPHDCARCRGRRWV
jgi:very-short-patch-repair endonuclease